MDFIFGRFMKQLMSYVQFKVNTRAFECHIILNWMHEIHYFIKGAQWLSGRVLDLRLKGCGFEPLRRHCIVVLEQDTFILA